MGLQPAAIAPHSDDLELQGLVLTGTNPIVKRAERCAILWGNNIENALSGDLVKVLRLDHLKAGRIHVQQRSISRDELHALGFRLEDRAQMGFGAQSSA